MLLGQLKFDILVHFILTIVTAVALVIGTEIKPMWKNFHGITH